MILMDKEKALNTLLKSLNKLEIERNFLDQIKDIYKNKQQSKTRKAYG